jgi:hypothetical protein
MTNVARAAYRHGPATASERPQNELTAAPLARLADAGRKLLLLERPRRAARSTSKCAGGEVAERKSTPLGPYDSLAAVPNAVFLLDRLLGDDGQIAMLQCTKDSPGAAMPPHQAAYSD